MTDKIKRKKTPFVYRTKEKLKEEPLIAVFDIETQGFGGPIIEGCITYQDKPGEYTFFRTGRELLEHMLAMPVYRYYAHNGGGFDFCYFVEELIAFVDEKGAQVDTIKQGQSKIIGYQVVVPTANKRKPIRLDIRDSYALINLSLAKAATVFAPELPKSKAINFEAGDVYDPINPEHRDYLKRDCDALVAVILRYSLKIKEVFGISPGYTAGSTAIKAWKAHIPEGHVYYRLNEKVEEWVREAYYGGYVHPGYETGVHEDTVSIDLNGAYAAAMRKGVPTGNPGGTYRRYTNRFGIYRVIAHVPEDIAYPCVPSRDKHGFLQWVTGDFETVITSIEMEFAEKRGCTFEVIEGQVWFRWEYPFNEFLDRCEEMELEGGEMKEIAKLQRNSLYGKFGTKLEQDSVVLSPVPPTNMHMPLIDETTGEPIAGVWVIKEKSDADYIQPAWAAVITAHQRLRLFEIMEGVGIEHFRYADTDSVKADRRDVERVIENGLVSVAPGYGNVKIDEEYSWFECFGVKNYAGYRTDGTFVAKTKGIPKRLLSERVVEQVRARGISEELHFTSMNAPLQHIKRRTKELATERKRRVGTLSNSKSWIVREDGRIRPRHVSL